MEFDHPELKLSYSVNEAPTTRDVLRYDGTIATWRGADMYLRFWEAARQLIVYWNAPIELTTDLDAAADMQTIEIIKTVGLEVFSYRQHLDEISKNS